MASLEGKVIALTGAGSGIGLATAQLLASRGAILSLCDKNASALEDAVRSLSPPPASSQKAHMSAVVDVRSPSEVNSWTATTVEKLGPLDGAANIAGMLGEQAPIRDATDQDWESVMGVNAKGVFNCLRAQFNNIKEGGSIVNVGSIASLVARPAQGTYVASKHAVLGLTRTAAREEGARGVRVNCVAPGVTRTAITGGVEEERLHEMTARHQSINRIADPKEIANLMAFLLSDESKFVTGAIYEISGGWTA